MSFQETFKALSDPTRREILRLLRDRAKTAGEIGSHFDMTGATISHHPLRAAGGGAHLRPAAGKIHLLRAQPVPCWTRSPAGSPA